MEDVVFDLVTGFLIAAAAEEPQGSLIGVLFPILLIGGVFYFLMIRPQRQRAKAANQMRDQVDIGSDIRTIGGIYGTVTGIDGDDLTVDIGGGTRIRIIRRAVAEILSSPEGEA